MKVGGTRKKALPTDTRLHPAEVNFKGTEPAKSEQSEQVFRRRAQAQEDIYLPNLIRQQMDGFKIMR